MRSTQDSGPDWRSVRSTKTGPEGGAGFVGNHEFASGVAQRAEHADPPVGVAAAPGVSEEDEDLVDKCLVLPRPEQRLQVRGARRGS